MDTRAQRGLVSGVILAVFGAVLRYAVTADVEGVDLNAVGGILLVAGAVLAAFGVISAITASIRNRKTTVHHYEREPSSTVVEREE